MKQSKIIVHVKGGMVQGVRSNNPNISVEIWDEDAPDRIFEKYNLIDDPKIDVIEEYFKNTICKEYPRAIL